MKRLKEILSRVLEIDEDSITDETSPENIENWDSFSGLLLVSELERVFKIRFTMQEVTEVKNVGDIIEKLKNHRINLNDD